MKREIPFIVAASVAVFVAGCASVNSSKSSDRLAVVAAMTDEDKLFSAIEQTRYEDVRNEAASRIRREDLSLRLLNRTDLNESTRIRLVRNVRDSSELKNFAEGSLNSKAFRMAALDGIADEALLVDCAGNIDDPGLQNRIAERVGAEANCKALVSMLKFDRSAKIVALKKIRDEAFLRDVVVTSGNEMELRKTALDGIQSEERCRELLDARPVLETWVWDHAIARVSDQETLAKAAATREASFSVRKAALDRIDDDSKFLELLRIEPPLEDWVLEKAIPHISDQTALVAVVREKKAGDGVRELALRRVEDEAVMLAVVEDRNESEKLRRLALSSVRSESAADELLRANPIFEPWICEHAVSLLSDEDALGRVFLNAEFADEVRLSAGEKISSPSRMKDLFVASTDDLSAGFALPRIEDGDMGTDSVQARLLELFRTTDDLSLAHVAWEKLGPGVDFCRKSDQNRLVAMIAGFDDDADTDRMLAELFDDGALLELASGRNERLAQAVVRLRPNAETALAIAETSPFPSVQCSALTFLDEEKAIARLAKTGPSRAVRIAAVSRLTAASTALLAEMAEDADSVVSETCRRKLKALGGTNALAEMERKAEIARREEAAKAEAERRTREERERVAAKELADRELQILADAQIHSFRHYLGVLEQYPDIGKKSFRFSGRFETADGRHLVLSLPHAGGGSFRVDIKLINKLSRAPTKGEVLTVSGRYKNGTQQSVELDSGSVVCFGVPTGPSDDVEKRIQARAAIKDEAGAQIREFRKFIGANDEKARKKSKATFQFSGIVAAMKYHGRELSLSVPDGDEDTFSVFIGMDGTPPEGVQLGAAVTVAGRYRKGTDKSAELDKGSVIRIGTR